MAGERQDGNIPVAGIVAVLLVLTSAIIPQQGPLLSSRPGGINVGQSNNVGNIQDVDARLWEDPFDAVHRHQLEMARVAEKVKGATNGAALATHHRAEAITTKVSELLAEKPAPDDLSEARAVAALAAMVFAGPYPEDAEHRRRARYATLSGLKVAGYFPDDAEHVGYIELSEEERRVEPNAPPLPSIVPYEWFTAGPSNRALPRRLLVLWLDELAFQQNPLGRLDRLLCRVLGSAQAPSAPDPCAPQHRPKRPDGLPVVVLGPAGSNSLEAMVSEIGGKDDKPGRAVSTSWLAGATMYSPTTTTSALSLTATGSQLVGSEPEAEARLSKLFLAKREIALFRVAVPDTTVMLELVKELGYRGVNLVPAADASDCRKVDHVALISEWDTVYGRALPNAFEAAMEGATVKSEATVGRQRPCENVHRYSYMRGLDGTLRRPGGGPDGDKKDKNDAKPGPADDKLERAEGTSQIDYLRRLASRFRDEDRRRQHEGQGRIRAIGVLGSDVYDKLMILQAVRGDFPDAVLFTTEFDARLIQSGEYARTRNLIVASGYGPQLHHRLQSDIAPFRSADQTATFLATQLAMERLVQLAVERAVPARPTRTTRAATEALRDWKKSAQVFEIGRTGALELSRARSGTTCTSMSDCKNPRPAAAGYYVQQLRPGLAWMLPLAAMVGLGLLLLSSWTVRSAAHHVGVAFGRGLSRRRPFFCVAVLFVLAVGAFGVYALVHALQRDDAEPFALFEGISVWPSELVRLVALAIAIQGFVYVCRRLGGARGKLTERFFPAQAGELKHVRATWVHIASWRGLRRIFAGGKRRAEVSQSFDATGAWHEHMYQSSPAARMVRVALMTTLFLIFGGVLVQGVFRPPHVPYRGAWTAMIDQALLWPVVILVLAMLFAIVDEIRLCDKFSSGLARSSRTEWPEPTLARFREERDVPDEMLTRWVDVRLIADWTAVMAPLVYYPAVVIVLMLVSRSTLLDAWDMPVGLLLVFVLSAVYTLACALTLRRVAERTRAGCVEGLGDAIFRATGQLDAHRPLIERLKLLKDEVASIRRGAFVPFTQQPVVRAILLAISSGAGLVVTQYLVTR